MHLPNFITRPRRTIETWEREGIRPTPSPARSPRSIREAVTDAVGTEDIAKAESATTKMALALAATGKSVYGGTVPPAVIARRRAKNKAARRARRATR